jgi:hypothetical protein
MLRLTRSRFASALYNLSTFLFYNSEALTLYLNWEPDISSSGVVTIPVAAVSAKIRSQAFVDLVISWTSLTR